MKKLGGNPIIFNIEDVDSSLQETSVGNLDSNLTKKVRVRKYKNR
jgi:hypothetical protein